MSSTSAGVSNTSHPARPAAADGRLAGRVALITGTGGGQGRAAALRFAAEGAAVVGCDSKADGSQETVEMVRASGGRMTVAHPLDLSDAEAARSWVDGAVAEYGRIDVLYNNAAAARFSPVAELSDADWHTMSANEVDLMMYVCRAAWPHLVRQRVGSIISTGSISGVPALPATPGNFAHAATKGAVISLARELALQGGPHGIRANCLSPGIIQSSATAELLSDPERRAAHLDALMLRRIAIPDDVAGAALFLASDDSAWVAGINVMVDGGYVDGGYSAR